MIRLLSDEDFNGRIVHGLLLRKSDLDLLRVQDVGLGGADAGETSSGPTSMAGSYSRMMDARYPVLVSGQVFRIPRFK